LIVSSSSPPTFSQNRCRCLVVRSRVTIALECIIFCPPMYLLVYGIQVRTPLRFRTFALRTRSQFTCPSVCLSVRRCHEVCNLRPLPCFDAQTLSNASHHLTDTAFIIVVVLSSRCCSTHILLSIRTIQVAAGLVLSGSQAAGNEHEGLHHQDASGGEGKNGLGAAFRRWLSTGQATGEVSKGTGDPEYAFSYLSHQSSLFETQS
jgi:hypothetical protein